MLQCGKQLLKRSLRRVVWALRVQTMYIKNKHVKQIYRLLFLLACEAGLILEFVGVSTLGGAKMLLCYYTVLSNIVCFLYFAFLVIAQPARENALTRGAVTMCITVTGLVYHFLLTGVMEASVDNVSTLLLTGNTLVHYVVPIGVVLDYFLFFPKGNYKPLYPLAWLVLPYAYFIFILIRAEVSSATFSGYGGQSRFPYPFLDVDAYGWSRVLLMVFAITVVFTALGYLAFVLDRLLGRTRKHAR